MKYGLLTYDTHNIGDDIQSIAAEQFLPSVDYLVLRDNIGSFDKECKLIMNGWFMHKYGSTGHQKYKFPPKENIKPLITSFHLDTTEIFDKEYFKKHEPIGCRDLYTLGIMQDAGIDAYFSGCMTLTLKRPDVERTEEVFCVDVGPEYKGIHLTHETFEKDYHKRKQAALDLLNKYARAKKVITSRLHCYLPCIAFGTPVELVGYDKKRFDGLMDVDKNVIDNLKKKIFEFTTERNITYLNKEALEDLKKTVKDLKHNKGIFIEAGCALGGSAITIAKAKDVERKFYVYDVFETIPEPSERDGKDVHDRYETIKSGKSKGINGDKYYGYEDNLLEKVIDNFNQAGIEPQENNVKFVKGMFQDTLKINEPVAFAHIDCDWYDSVYTCLERIVPNLVDGGVLIIDDYHSWSGAKKAVDDYFKDKKGFKFIKKNRLHIVKKPTVSIFTSCRNRQNNLYKALPSWKKQNVDEIVILDYGSDKPIIGAYRIEADKYHMTKASNMAVSLCKGDIIIKCDADYILNVDIVEKVNLQEGEFYSGQGVKPWVDGFIMCWKKDFERVNGYNENMKYYSYDDIDLYQRLERIGLKHKRINKSWVTHIDHSNSDRLREYGLDGRTDKHLQRICEISKRIMKEQPWTVDDLRSVYKPSRKNFIMLFTGRCGSSYIYEKINAHDNVTMESEVLDKYRDIENNEERFLAMKNEINSLYYNDKNVVGFKTKLYPEVWNEELLKRLKDVLERNCVNKVIVLLRKDKVKQAISSIRGRQIFNKYGRWNLYKGEKIDDSNISKAEIEESIRGIRDREKEIDKFLSILNPCDRLNIFYEDLLDNEKALFEKIYSFLGVEYQETESNVIKATSDSLKNVNIECVNDKRSKYE